MEFADDLEAEFAARVWDAGEWIGEEEGEDVCPRGGEGEGFWDVGRWNVEIALGEGKRVVISEFRC